jgi:hypothetical protein
MNNCEKKSKYFNHIKSYYVLNKRYYDMLISI